MIGWGLLSVLFFLRKGASMSRNGKIYTKKRQFRQMPVLEFLKQRLFLQPLHILPQYRLSLVLIRIREAFHRAYASNFSICWKNPVRRLNRRSMSGKIYFRNSFRSMLLMTLFLARVFRNSFICIRFYEFLTPCKIKNFVNILTSERRFDMMRLTSLGIRKMN